MPEVAHVGQLFCANVSKVALTAPPVDGAANSALIAFLSEALGVPARDIAIERGERGRHKTIRIAGVSADAVRTLATLDR